jgi:hypothetical protein
MDEVPIARHSFDGAILAHRRHHDAISKRDTANRERAKQIGFRYFAVVIGLSRAAVGGGLRGGHVVRFGSVVHNRILYSSASDL